MLEHVNRVCDRGNGVENDEDMRQVQELLGESISRQYQLLMHLNRFQNTVDSRGVCDLGGQGGGGFDAGVGAAIPAQPECRWSARVSAENIDLAAATAGSRGFCRSYGSYGSYGFCRACWAVRRVADGPPAGATSGEAAAAEHGGSGAGPEADAAVRGDFGLGGLGGGEAVGSGHAASRGRRACGEA